MNIIIGEGEFIIPALVSGRCKQIPEQENDQKVVYRVNKNSEYFPKDISNIFLNRKYLGNEIIYTYTPSLFVKNFILPKEREEGIAVEN